MFRAFGCGTVLLRCLTLWRETLSVSGVQFDCLSCVFRSHSCCVKHWTRHRHGAKHSKVQKSSCLSHPYQRVFTSRHSSNFPPFLFFFLRVFFLFYLFFIFLHFSLFSSFFPFLQLSFSSISSFCVLCFSFVLFFLVLFFFLFVFFFFVVLFLGCSESYFCQASVSFFHKHFE